MSETSLTVTVPGSKSLTNRALLLAALTKGTSRLHNVLDSEDTRVMRRALGQLGVAIKMAGNTATVYGTGALTRPQSTLKLKNAGTAVRFLTALLSHESFEAVIDGNERMRKRPLKDLIDALKKCGANIKAHSGCPPVHFKGGPLTGHRTSINGNTSSQYLSALLMLGPRLAQGLEIEVKGTLTSKPYVDLTLEMMKKFGIRGIEYNGHVFKVPSSPYQAIELNIEPDASSATYFFGLAALTGQPIEVRNLTQKSHQPDLLILKALKKMGCTVHKTANGIKVKGPRDQLKALGTLNANAFPDGAMTLAVIAAFAHGTSILTGLHNLKIKESNRLKALETELNKIGANTSSSEDSLTIQGNPEILHSARIKTYHDHRIAMCFGMATSRLRGIQIENPRCVDKTFPAFWTTMKQIQRAPNIILTGMRGTGKTTLGKALAKHLGWTFVDIDDCIEQRVEQNLHDFIEQKGWPAFRDIEKIIAQECAALEKTVIATGGGTLMDEQTTSALKKNGVVILLICDPKTLRKNIEKSHARPALTQTGSTLDEIETVWNERKERYHAVADFVHDTSTWPSIEALLKKLKKLPSLGIL